jgi:hypothetical protein
MPFSKYWTKNHVQENYAKDKKEYIQWSDSLFQMLDKEPSTRILYKDNEDYV